LRYFNGLHADPYFASGKFNGRGPMPVSSVGHRERRSMKRFEALSTAGPAAALLAVAYTPADAGLTFYGSLTGFDAAYIGAQ